MTIDLKNACAGLEYFLFSVQSVFKEKLPKLQNAHYGLDQKSPYWLRVHHAQHN